MISMSMKNTKTTENNHLSDEHPFFCPYCSEEIFNNAKYDFTRYYDEMKAQNHIKSEHINKEDGESLPSNLLFLIATKDIDTLFESESDKIKTFEFVEKKSTDLSEGVFEAISLSLSEVTSLLEATPLSETASLPETTPLSEAASLPEATPKGETLDNFCKYFFESSNKALIRDGSDFHYREIECKSEFTIRLEKGGLSNLTAITGNKKIPIDIKRCPRCLNILSNELGKYKMINIGLIGSIGAGKTSLLVAIHHFIANKKFDSNNFGIEGITIVSADTTYEPTDVGIRLEAFDLLYQSGMSLPATLNDNTNITNLNIKIASKKSNEAKIINIVDVAGEFWSNKRNNVDIQELINKRPIIGECDNFIVCMADSDIVSSADNYKFAQNIVNVISRIREDNINKENNINKEINCCCIINKVDKLVGVAENGIDNILEHISSEGMTKARYFDDDGKLLYSNGSYKNLQITAKEIFIKLAITNENELLKMGNIVFFPISPYGFQPSNLSIDKTVEEITDEIKKAEVYSTEKPNPWHLEAFLTWLIHQTELIIGIK